MVNALTYTLAEQPPSFFSFILRKARDGETDVGIRSPS